MPSGEIICLFLIFIDKIIFENIRLRQAYANGGWLGDVFGTSTSAEQHDQNMFDATKTVLGWCDVPVEDEHVTPYTQGYNTQWAEENNRPLYTEPPKPKKNFFEKVNKKLSKTLSQKSQKEKVHN